MSRKQSKEDEIPLTVHKPTILQETKARFDSLLKAAHVTHPRNPGDEVEERNQKIDKWFGTEEGRLQDSKRFKRRSSKKLSSSTQMLVTDDHNTTSSSDPDDFGDQSHKHRDSMKQVGDVISMATPDELPKSHTGEDITLTSSPVTKAMVHSVVDSDVMSKPHRRPLPVLPKRQSTRDESRETTSSRVSSPDSVMTAIEAGSPNRNANSSSSESSRSKGVRTEEFELKPLKGLSPSYEEIDETPRHSKKFPGSPEGNLKGLATAASYEEIIEESGKYKNYERADNGQQMEYESTRNWKEEAIQKKMRLRMNSGKNDTNTDTSSCERTQIHSKQKRPRSHSRKRVKSHKENDLPGAKTVYSYEKIIGISLHRTDTLKIDSLIKHPMVRVHLIDTVTGEYLKKSQKDRSVSFYQEEPNIDYIQSIMTQPCNFKDPRSLTPVWEETLIFNEDIRHILQPHSSTLILFEVLDCVSFDTAVAQYQRLGFESGWHRIAWAFLKPCGPNNILNIDKRLRLQLYKPRHDKPYQGHSVCEKCDVYRWWSKGGWVLYPSTLHVTVHALSIPSEVSPAARSYFSLQPEELGTEQFNIDDDVGKNFNDHAEDSKTTRNIFRDTKWSRLSSQSCKIPNEEVSNFAAGQQGCFSVCFSHHGNYLALIKHNDRMHSICVFRIPDGSEVIHFQGHPGLVYSMNWSSDDNMLLSASADCTACIWSIRSQDHFPFQMLPHPSFVYCAVFLPTDMSLATGCRDHVIRIWKWNDSSGNYELLKELNSHEGYVSTLCVNTDGILFSGDSIGQIKMWQCNESRWSYLSTIAVRELQGIVLSHLITHPGGKRLLVLARDSLLRMVDISTGVAIQWYKGALNHRIHSKACITPCGGLVFAPSEDGTFYVWNADTGMLLASYNALFLNLPSQYIEGLSGCNSSLTKSIQSGTVDYHPFEHMAVFSVYGVHAPVIICKYNRDSQGKDIGLHLKADYQNEQLEPESETKSFTESALFLPKAKATMKIMGKTENIDVVLTPNQMVSEVPLGQTKKETPHLFNILKQLDHVLQLSRSPRQEETNTDSLLSLQQRGSNLTPDGSLQVCNSPSSTASDTKAVVKETKSEVAYTLLHSTSASGEQEKVPGQPVRDSTSSHQIIVTSPTKLQYVMEKEPPCPMPRLKKIKPLRSERQTSVADLSTTDTSLLSSDNENPVNPPFSKQTNFPQIMYENEKESRKGLSDKFPNYSQVRGHSQSKIISSFDSDSDI